MNSTISEFSSKKQRSIDVMDRLYQFLKDGELLGAGVDSHLLEKMERSLTSVKEEKLKIALVGGFSEGKTTIAAAWLGKIDKSTMKISQLESSDGVNVYEVDSEVILIDTPGLYGFKEKFDAASGKMERFRDITKKYVSEAHLILYVMDPVNPIKESHKDDLVLLFKDLALLPRTVFVLSRFDAVADVADDEDYMENLQIKRNSVASMLSAIIGLSEDQLKGLSIVGVAPNPFDAGIEEWLQKPDEYHHLSRIHSLQSETVKKVAQSGGLEEIVNESKNSVVRDVLKRQLPVAIAADEQIGLEVERLEDVVERTRLQMKSLDAKISEARLALRAFAISYFSDLIVQLKGTSMETFPEFFEREVGDAGIIIDVNVKNEFERRVGAISDVIAGNLTELKSDVDHYNNVVSKFGKQGVDFVVKGGYINNSTIIAARDGVVAAGKMVGIELGKMLKFKPWGAIKLAKGLNGALVVFGIGMEAWELWKEKERMDKFNENINKMVKSFEDQRKQLIDVVDSGDFHDVFFPAYTDLSNALKELGETVRERSQRREKFAEWRRQGEMIEAEFISGDGGTVRT